MLGGLSIHCPVANYLWCICAKKIWKLASSRQSYCKNNL